MGGFTESGDHSRLYVYASPSFRSLLMSVISKWVAHWLALQMIPCFHSTSFRMLKLMTECGLLSQDAGACLFTARYCQRCVFREVL